MTCSGTWVVQLPEELREQVELYAHRAGGLYRYVERAVRERLTRDQLEHPMRRCFECGELMCIGPCEHEDSPGVTHHLIDGMVDYDLDADHVAY